MDRASDPEAEKATLCVAMQNHEARYIVLDRLTESDYTSYVHKEVFKAINEVHNAGAEVEPVTVQTYLRDKGTLEMVGGTEAIVELIQLMPMAEDVGSYCKIVQRASAYRKLMQVGRELIDSADPTRSSSSDPEAEAARAIEALTGKVAEKSVFLTQSCMVDYEQWKAEYDIRMRSPGDYPGWAFKPLQKMLGPWLGSELVVIGGAAHMGKTAFSLTNAVNLGLRGVPIGYFSLEMSRSQIAKRLAHYGKQFSGNSYEQLKDLRKCPIYVDDSTTDLNKIIARTRLLKAQRNIDAIFIDHLGHVHADGRFQNDHSRLGYITKKFLRLSRELAIDIILLCQYSRASRRDSLKPNMHDLRDSGSIEEDADKILLLSHPHSWDPAQEETVDRYETYSEHGAVKVARQTLYADLIKNRNQEQKGGIELLFDYRKGWIMEVPSAKPLVS